MSEPTAPLLAIRIREGKPEDLNLVFRSWKKSLEKYHRDMTLSAYYAYMNNTCDEILAGMPRIFVACSPEDEDVILGYLVCEATPQALVLWFAYTMLSWRQERVAKRLLAHAVAELDPELSAAGVERTVYCAETKHCRRVQALELRPELVSWAKALRMRHAR